MLIREETIPQKANQQYGTCWRDTQNLPNIDSKEPILTVQFVYKQKEKEKKARPECTQLCIKSKQMFLLVVCCGHSLSADG